MKAIISRTALLITLALSGCGLDDAGSSISIKSFSFDFSESDHGWSGGFCDFPTGYDSSLYQFQYEYTSLPGDESSPNAIMLSGHNYSKDLFMYLKKHITGLEPETNYTITYEVEFASNAMLAASSGKSVFLKVGASAMEPKSIIDEGHYALNIDKGNLVEDGEDMVTIGDIAPRSTDAGGYTLDTRSNSPEQNESEKSLIVKTNKKGELWLIVGTDSGIGELTTMYYTEISAVLSRSN